MKHLYTYCIEYGFIQKQKILYKSYDGYLTSDEKNTHLHNEHSNTLYNEDIEKLEKEITTNIENEISDAQGRLQAAKYQIKQFKQNI